MPPVKKYTKEEIIEVAYEIVKHEGIKGINARRIAKEMESSVQPIFHNFRNMEELNREVYYKIYLKYKAYMLRAENSSQPYKEMGLAYIRFARDYPEFFKIIFMQETSLKAEKFIMADSMSDDLIKAGQKFTGLSYQEQKKFHVKVWVFTHGIACLVATKTVDFNEDEVKELLGSTVLEMLKGKDHINE